MGITVFGSFVFLGHLNLPDAVVVDFNGLDSFAVNLYNLVDEDFIGRPSLENLTPNERKAFFSTLLMCVVEYYTKKENKEEKPST